MRGDRDDTVPLFPGLHINNDGDKGGPRPPPRNKMALFDVDSEIHYRSRSTVPPRNDSVASFVSRGSSSSNVVSGKRKVGPILATMNECPTTTRGDEDTLHSGKSLEKNIGRRKMGWGVGDCNQQTEIDSIHHDRASKLGNADTRVAGVDLTTDEVVRVIGERLFLEARKTMIHQQKMFSWQMLELHRLITVQRLIARSPESFHPMNRFSPLDTSSSVARTKCDPVGQPLPWCFPPPSGNQWLIPVRSPSEGLVYKPYPGPCFPTVGFMPPVLMNASCSANEVDPKLVSHLHTQKESALSLFPTTPSVHKVQVVKVVPYTPNSTPASVARILQSIQQGRRKHH